MGRTKSVAASWTFPPTVARGQGKNLKGLGNLILSTKSATNQRVVVAGQLAAETKRGSIQKDVVAFCGATMRWLH